MEYILTIRIPLPLKVKKVISREKKRLVTKYGSGYESEPHITLYLGRYSKSGFSRLVEYIETVSIKSFNISLLNPGVTMSKNRSTKFFFLDVSSKKQIHDLHTRVLKAVALYRGSLLRRKDQNRVRQGLFSKKEVSNLNKYGYARVLKLFSPHITLGEVGTDRAGPKLSDLRKNLASIKGVNFAVDRIVLMLYEKESEKIKARLLEKSVLKLG